MHGDCTDKVWQEPLYRDASFMILDEPKAALEPIAEYGVYYQLWSLQAQYYKESGNDEIYIRN